MRDRGGADARKEKTGEKRKNVEEKDKVCAFVCMSVCVYKNQREELRRGGRGSKGRRKSDIDRLCCRNWGVLCRD